MSDPCPCVARHAPSITEEDCDDHHSPPKAWPLAPGATRKVHHICVQTHRKVHDALNHMRRNGGKLGARANRYSRFARNLAAEAWANADHSGPGPLPNTTIHG